MLIFSIEVVWPHFVTVPFFACSKNRSKIIWTLFSSLKVPTVIPPYILALQESVQPVEDQPHPMPFKNTVALCISCRN